MLLRLVSTPSTSPPFFFPFKNIFPPVHSSHLITKWVARTTYNTFIVRFREVCAEGAGPDNSDTSFDIHRPRFAINRYWCCDLGCHYSQWWMKGTRVDVKGFVMIVTTKTLNGGGFETWRATFKHNRLDGLLQPNGVLPRQWTKMSFYYYLFYWKKHSIKES
jgi:hypothetical protein